MTKVDYNIGDKVLVRTPLGDVAGEVYNYTFYDTKLRVGEPPFDNQKVSYYIKLNRPKDNIIEVYEGSKAFIISELNKE